VVGLAGLLAGVNEYASKEYAIPSQINSSRVIADKVDLPYLNSNLAIAYIMDANGQEANGNV
jgi:hypothetical protein